MNGMQDNTQSRGADLPGQIVLVLQGGGALGSYQAGVYQALHEAGIEPDWIIGTSSDWPTLTTIPFDSRRWKPLSSAARS